MKSPIAREPRERNPYVGLRPFASGDREFFAGRNFEAEDVVSHIVAESALVLHGRTGVGKTSLVNARIIPLLEAKGFQVFPLARVNRFVPGNMQTKEAPNPYVLSTLLSWATHKADPDQLANFSLARFLKDHKRQNIEMGEPAPRAIIFDQ